MLRTGILLTSLMTMSVCLRVQCVCVSCCSVGRPCHTHTQTHTHIHTQTHTHAHTHTHIHSPLHVPLLVFGPHTSNVRHPINCATNRKQLDFTQPNPCCQLSANMSHCCFCRCLPLLCVVDPPYAYWYTSPSYACIYPDILNLAEFFVLVFRRLSTLGQHTMEIDAYQSRLLSHSICACLPPWVNTQRKSTLTN